jgi:thiamine pyrophosphate-dependent acetolactate synthase large subunit-like protein
MTPSEQVRTEGLTVPPSAESEMEWWSDAFAELLRRFDIPYMSLNPGASFRGLHDSIVNHLGNERPGMILTLHEEHAVAVAHGYAKVTERPMLVGLHTNVGLMHASMAIYNAFCDRVPMLIVGASGPLAADRRRPWIEWIHTAGDLGALVRNFVKWDDQPVSGPATLEALARAHSLTASKPCAPVYVCIDQEVQEQSLEGDPPTLPNPDRHPPVPSGDPPAAESARILALLGEARRPLILMGRVGRGEAQWQERVALAEGLGAAVLTDMRVAAGFPSDHPLNTAVPGSFLTDSGQALLRDADVVLSLDWVDLGGTLTQAYGTSPVDATIISCSTDHVLFNGWNKDHGQLPTVDIAVGVDPGRLVHALADRLVNAPQARRDEWPPARPASPPVENGDASAEGVDPRVLAREVYRAVSGGDICLARVPIGWPGEILNVAGPLDYLGIDGGGGVGSGPGMAVGTALALAGSDRLTVAVLGDGDFLMGCQALWTAARYGLAMLVVVANNGSFFNDEMHQQRMAQRRGRPVENRAEGIEIAGPEPDLAELARSLGLAGYGPVADANTLASTLTEAAAAARSGAAVVVDVRTRTAGYPGSAPTPEAVGVSA